MSNEALRLADSVHEMNSAAYMTAIANLREQVTRANRETTRIVALLDAAKDERDQLRAEVERLRADAERYEWLRDNLESEWAICEWQDDPDGLGYYRDARASHIVDAAIDAARTHKDTP